MSTTSPAAVRRMMRAVRAAASILHYNAPDWSAGTWQSIFYAASVHAFTVPKTARTPSTFRLWLQAHPGFYATIRTHLATTGLTLPDPKEIP